MGSFHNTFIVTIFDISLFLRKGHSFLVIGLLFLRADPIFGYNLYIFDLNRTFLEENQVIFLNRRAILSYENTS